MAHTKVLDRDKQLREKMALDEEAKKKQLSEARSQRTRAARCRKQRRKEAKGRCAKGRVIAKKRAQDDFQINFARDLQRQKDATAERHAKRKATRAAAETACALDMLAMEDKSAEEIEKAAKELAAARAALLEEQREHRQFWRRVNRRSRARVPAAQRRRERKQESDDEVRANLPPHLIPVFERHKRFIQARARMTRTEVFAHWLHEHPDAVQEAQMATLPNDAALDAEANAWFLQQMQEQPIDLSDDVPF